MKISITKRTLFFIVALLVGTQVGLYLLQRKQLKTIALRICMVEITANHISKHQLSKIYFLESRMNQVSLKDDLSLIKDYVYVINDNVSILLNQKNN